MWCDLLSLDDVKPQQHYVLVMEQSFSLNCKAVPSVKKKKELESRRLLAKLGSKHFMNNLNKDNYCEL